MKKKVIIGVVGIIAVYVLFFCSSFLAPVCEAYETSASADYDGVSVELTYVKNESFDIIFKNNSKDDLAVQSDVDLYKKRGGIWVKERFETPDNFVPLQDLYNVESGNETNYLSIPYYEKIELGTGEYKLVFEARKSTWGEQDVSWFDIEVEFVIE